VGPQLLLQQLQVQPSLGCLILRPDSTSGSQQHQQQLQLDWVPADELVVLVVELLATPVGVAVDQVCIMLTSGWTSSHHIQNSASRSFVITVTINLHIACGMHVCCRTCCCSSFTKAQALSLQS
jgi:hypothetical protein